MPSEVVGNAVHQTEVEVDIGVDVRVACSKLKVNRSDIREEMAVSFPNWTQSFWDWLTGRPLKPHDKSTSERDRLYAVCMHAGLYVALILGGPFVLSTTNIAEMSFTLQALLMGFMAIVITGRARYQQVISGHHAMHNAVAKNAKLNKLIGELVTALVFAQGMAGYRYDHAKHHQSRHFGGFNDPDAWFLNHIGLGPNRAYDDTAVQLSWAN